MQSFKNNSSPSGFAKILNHSDKALVSPEARADLSKFLLDRRFHIDLWVFTIRLILGIGILGYLLVRPLISGQPFSMGMFWAGAYVLGNLLLHLAHRRGFTYARWGYATLDFLGIVLLRHFQFDAFLDPNATMIGVFTLFMIGYINYTDIRLTSVMVVATLVMTVATLWLDVLYISTLSVLLPTKVTYYAQPLPALFLLSYVATVSLISHQLVHRLYTNMLQFTVEQHERTKGAVVSALERSRRERLEELTEMKHKFITVISHELRNPITPLLSSLDILENEMLGQGTPNELVGIAKESASRIQRIITDYTRLAELITMEDDGLLRWNLHLHDLIALVQEQTITKPQIVGGFENMDVCSDPRLLGGALLALMRRAEMLAPPDATITLYGSRERRDVVLSIHDPVSYLEQSVIASLDDPFALNDERTFTTENTGLELILAQHSLRRIGGTLRIESAPQLGTTIHCKLPGDQPGIRWLDNGHLRRELGVIGL